MKGFVKNIEGIAVKNEDFRRVLYTAKNCQLVVMALKPKEEIGMEVHKLDQFFRVEEGAGEAVLDGVRTVISAGFAVLVPAGTNHNIINTGSAPLKLYTLYSPPNHRDGVVHHTRAEAEKDNEHLTAKRRNRVSTACCPGKTRTLPAGSSTTSRIQTSQHIYCCILLIKTCLKYEDGKIHSGRHVTFRRATTR